MDDDSTEAQPESPPPVSDPAVADAAPVAAPASSVAVAEEHRSGVHIPTWLAGALVVVLAFLIGIAGFAVGRSTADDGRGFRPALVRDQSSGGRQFPGGQQGGQPGGQDGQRQGPSGNGDRGPGTQGRSDDGGGAQAPSGPGSSSGSGNTGTRGS